MDPEAQDDGPDILHARTKDEIQRRATEVANRAVASYRRRIDWDVRGIIAVMAVVGAFALAFAQLMVHGDANIPAWAATTVGAIVGFYFGGRSGSDGHMRRKDD